MDRDDRAGGDSSNMVRSIQKEVQSVEYRADSTKQRVDHDDLTAQNVRRDTNKNMNSNVRAIKMKEETNAVEESYDLPSDEWVVESADDSGQEDGPISDEDEESAEIDELVDLSKSIASDETSNFWYLLRACALGEERIGRFILNGIDYVVMGEMAFECDAKTNLVDYSAKRKLKHTLLHTVEEVFLCYLYYTRGRFQAYARRLGKLRKRRIGAASAVRLEEYLYVRNARLPEFISGMFPPPTPIKLSEILRGEKLPDSGWNPITFHQKFHGIQEIRRVSNEPQNVIKNSGIHPDSDQPMKSSSIEQIETNGTEAVNDSTNSEIKRSDFSTSEVHKVEHKRTNGRTVLLEGTFYNRSCYVQFLSNWLCHMKKASHVVHSTIPLSMEQRSALGLSKNQATVAHTYMVIDGLPPSEFYGGGFGVTAKLANWAASREMVTRLYHGGLVTPSLYNEIAIPLSMEQRSALGLSKNQATVAHTYMVIDGLPPSEFYGGGFGVTAKLANWAASREMVTRLYHGGLVTPSLYNEIEDDRTIVEDDRPPSTRACKQLRKRKREQFLISKAALETLDQYLAIEDDRTIIEDDRPPSTRACKQLRKRKREQFLISKAALETLDQYLAIGEMLMKIDFIFSND
uniref:PMD domain-containing protein n=1 Tax=Ascaris lumbricoides TaxID=6252 RepID=A0A0M3IMJ5_ASCLU